MPDEDCCTIPALNISICEAISASFGLSFNTGRKKRDNNIVYNPIKLHI